MSVYCNHDGCHDTRTASYWRTGTGTNGASGANLIGMSYDVVTGARRLCRIHALQQFGCALGGVA